MLPFEQTIAMQGQQALLPSPTQDPNEIATRQGAFMPFVENIKQSLTTPQGQMAALMIAQQMLQNRAPGEANGALPRLVDGALQGMGAIAQFNQNLQQADVQQQELGMKGEQLDVTRRGQDVQARGQDLQKTTSEAEIAAANERQRMSDETQRFGITKRAEADAADAAVRREGVAAQRDANQLEAQDRAERMAIEERQILATSEAARLKYGLDKDESTTKLITEATKAAIEASGMGQGTFDINFRNIYNNMAGAAGKNGIPGAPPPPDSITRGIAAAKKAQENGIDPNALLNQLAGEMDRKHGIDSQLFLQEVQKGLQKEYEATPAFQTNKDVEAFKQMDEKGLESYVGKSVASGIKMSFGSDPIAYRQALIKAATNMASQQHNTAK